jgi:hypothetical protein
MRSICLEDLDFPRIAIPALSERGVPYERWARVGMPRIPQNVIDSVFYLYRTREDAKAGRDPGGTGFIVSYPAGRDLAGQSITQIYAVTNWHVVCDQGCSVIRLNTLDGGTDVIEFGPEEWHFMPGKYDVAITPLSIDGRIHRVSNTSTLLFAQARRPAPDPRIGIGDDVFMIGLFVDHDGITTNVPSARFGNISMMPNSRATIKQPTGYLGESFVIDMHSRTGFSGSPVYVYRTFGADLAQGGGYEFEDIEFNDLNKLAERAQGKPFSHIKGRLQIRTLFEFLGIHWGQFPEKWELKDKKRVAESARKHLITDGAYVEGMSGMTCVIPAWQIMEVLDMPPLKGPRDEYFAAEKAAKVTSRSVPKPESAPHATDENPNHREDFMRLQGAAARKQKPDE